MNINIPVPHNHPHRGGYITPSKKEDRMKGGGVA